MKKTIYIIALLATGAALCYSVDVYRHSRIENRESKIEAAPAFTPSLHIVERDGQSSFAENPFAEAAQPEPWLRAKLIDKTTTDQSPGNTVLTSRFEPVVTREGDSWKIKFKP